MPLTLNAFKFTLIVSLQHPFSLTTLMVCFTVELNFLTKINWFDNVLVFLKSIN